MVQSNQNTPENRISRLEALAETTLLAIQQLVQQQQTFQSEMYTNIEDIVGMIGNVAEGQVQLQQSVLELAQGQTQLQQMITDLVQGQTHLQQSVLKLSAGQEQQSRVLDHLLRKEQERQNDNE